MTPRKTIWKLCRMPALLALAYPLVAGNAAAVTYNLVAMPFIKSLPGGQVTMWGYGPDVGAGSVPSVPGPALVVPPGDTSLTINLRNTLSEPVSIVIPGQMASMAPVKFTDTTGRQRVRSFTAEAAAGSGTQTYTWNNLKPGTYLYHSGTHPQVQVQMGLYGAMTHDAAAGQAYAGVPYSSQTTLLLSEVDPALHAAVAGGQYGPGNAMSSTIDYAPKYLLINGELHTDTSPHLAAASGGQPTLLRFLNAGLQTHVPVINGVHMQMIAEDGNPYPWPANPRQQYSVFLPAAKTVDAIITPPAGTYSVFDRRLNLSNAVSPEGGMLAVIDAGGTGTPWITSAPITTASLGKLYSYDVNATDPDGDTLTYSLDAAPTGMTINSVSGLISWPSAADGSNDVTVRVTDGGLSTTQSFTINTLPAMLYFSTTGNTAVPGVTGTPDNADVYSWDGASFARVLDATTVGVPGIANVDGLKVVGNLFYLSFSNNTGVTLPDVGLVQDEDIVVYDGGANSWSLYFDGSAAGLETDTEDVDAFDILANGNLIVSTSGGVVVPGLGGTRADEDVLRCVPTSSGPIASCTWSWYFDGSDVGLNTVNTEDVDGVSSGVGKLYLSTLGDYSVSGLSGSGGDVFSCDSPVTSGASSCAGFTLYFRASDHGITYNLDATSVP